MNPLKSPPSNDVRALGRPALRILVIDDDECVSTAIQAILARRCYRTELASRAYAGIQALNASNFDAVLVDIFMPGMNGIDTIAYLRRASAVPIIAMSGLSSRASSNSTDYLGMAIQSGASASIRKPFSPEQLVDAIDRSIGTAAIAEVSMR